MYVIDTLRIVSAVFMFSSSSYFCQLRVLLNQYHCILLSNQTVAQKREIEVDGRDITMEKEKHEPCKYQDSVRWKLNGLRYLDQGLFQPVS